MHANAHAPTNAQERFEGLRIALSQCRAVPASQEERGPGLGPSAAPGQTPRSVGTALFRGRAGKWPGLPGPNVVPVVPAGPGPVGPVGVAISGCDCWSKSIVNLSHSVARLLPPILPDRFPSVQTCRTQSRMCGTQVLGLGFRCLQMDWRMKSLSCCPQPEWF